MNYRIGRIGLVGMTYKERNVDLTNKKIFDEHGVEICKMCPWNKGSFHPESICEAYHCGEAMELFLEKEVRSMQDKLTEIRQRVEKATQGLWESWEFTEGNINGKNIYELIRLATADESYVDLDYCDVVYPMSGVLTHEDIVFIVHARQDITYLLNALQLAQDTLNRTEEEWELKVLERLTCCENEPNKSIIKINQELKIELQQSRAKERVYLETLKNLYLS